MDANLLASSLIGVARFEHAEMNILAYWRESHIFLAGSAGHVFLDE